MIDARRAGCSVGDVETAFTSMMNRRDFLVASGALAAARVLPRVAAPAASMKVLVLGGTNFVGPAIVQRALDNGHEVTLFNRGRTNPGLFRGIELLQGDRTPQAPRLGALEGARSWDVVINVWPSDPHIVAATARLLRDRVARYVFVSTVVAYRDLTQPGIVESAPLFDDVTDSAAWYEYDKAQCERVLQQLYGDRHAVCRPHIITGYRNPSDVLRMWAVRIDRGGEVLAPGDGSDPVQFVDVKDVAEFTLGMAERGLAGAYNLAAPAGTRLTFRQFLDAINVTTGSKANLTWVSDEFLQAQGVRAFSDLPMWLPLARTRRPGFMQVSTAKALANGLTLRPLASTVADEHRWFRETMPRDYEFGVPPSDKGFTRARERALLAAWHARS